MVKNILLKILAGFGLTVFTALAVGAAEFCLLDGNTFAIAYPFTLLEIILLLLLIYSAKALFEVAMLQRRGLRTEGTVTYIAAGRGSHYKIRYFVGGREYFCIASRLSQGEKYRLGDKATLLYSENAPEKACLEKDELIASIAMTAASVLLLAGFIAAECYALTAL